MKKGIFLLTFFGVCLILGLNLISADIIGDFLDGIGGENLILGSVFALTFIIISFSLNRVFNNKSLANSIGGILGLLLTYSVYRGGTILGFNFQSWIYNLIPESLIFTLLPWVIIGGLVYGGYRIGWWTAVLFGLALMALGIFNLVYARSLITIIGLIILLIGIFFLIKKKTGINSGRNPLIQTPQNTNNANCKYLYVDWKNYRVQFISLLKNPNYSQQQKKMAYKKSLQRYNTRQHPGCENEAKAIIREIVSIYNQLMGGQPSPQPQTPNQINRIITEAKTYRSWADQQSNPKFHRNWARFIGYLKQRGYGTSEKDICARMGISVQDLINVVNKYIK